MFAGASWLRWNNNDYVAGPVALALEVISFSLLGLTAWLGGELVDRLGVGVDDGAHLDAPNSLASSTCRLHAPDQAASRTR